ncbi:MAG: sigma 54-interacting transcriptional regulator [Candidatus Hydrogenedentes bacterium]|nr:sigma 54-interacting transcriptional regulator [Candidatus Hydrogenedentota bacterium]
MFQLICAVGSSKGTAHLVEHGGLTIGREPGCDIVLSDPLVSRRHCRVQSKDTGLWIEDLGSRNPTLVNGLPVERQSLRIGDEISVGGVLYLVGACARSVESGANGEYEHVQDTWSWDDAKPVSLDVERVSPPRQTRPKTIEDLMLLYKAAHEFASAMTANELLDALCRQLEGRLNPERLWIGRVIDGGTIVAYPCDHLRAGDWRNAPTSAMQQSISENRALLIPGTRREGEKKVLVFTMVAPVFAGGRSRGIVVLQTETPRGAYDERDLEFLVLLTRQLGPAISAVELYEALRRDNECLRARTGEARAIIGTSPGIEEVRRQIEVAARSDLSVLISGETGTGKELCARRLHAASRRASAPWIAVNCAAIPRELFESEVFGYEKGAFTGATERHDGLMAQAHGGTIFLDEVADLSPENQARILRCAEDGTFRALGAKKETHVDVRIVAASNRPLQTVVAEGKFRQDLYHRLAGFEISVPPLRERKQDIPILAEFFFEESRRVAERPVRGLSPEAIEALCAHSWPGNVRELRYCILRAVTVAQSARVEPGDLGLSVQLPVADQSGVALVTFAEAEKRHLEDVLRACKGDVGRAAKILGVGRSTLYRKMAGYGVQA